MKLSKKADYGVRAILYLAMQPPGSSIFVGEICKNQNIPPKFGAKIMQALVKGNIIKSSRGIKGGYSLAKKPEEISLLDVIEAADGTISFNRCVLDRDKCPVSMNCPVHFTWCEITNKFRKELNRVTFLKLSNDMKRRLSAGEIKTGVRDNKRTEKGGD